jgi:N-acetyl-anhydromuramyl-L-alanine amidase AmpD
MPSKAARKVAPTRKADPSTRTDPRSYVSAALGQWVQDQFARKRTPADLDEEVAALEKEVRELSRSPVWVPRLTAPVHSL